MTDGYGTHRRSGAPTSFDRAFVSGRVGMAEGSVAYRSGGRDGPAVILLHGASLDNGSITWRHVAEDLVTDHRVFAPDLPKHGESWPWHGRADQEALERVLLELMDHLELSAATLVGLSLGAAVSLGVARRAPDRVERMVLASAGGIQDRVTAHELAYLSLRTPVSWALTRAQSARSLERFARRRLPFADDVTEAEIDRLAAAYVAEYTAKRRHGGHVFSDWNRFEIGPRRMRTNHLPHLSEVSCPTLFVHGEEDTSVPVRLAREAAECMPQGRLEVVAGAGHFVAQDHPREVVRLVRTFMDEMSPDGPAP
ncbi:MAG TPA: alpha/beta fold hydrolase [Micromonosporaceae bacterium]|nr:alpha/beta fold hydrolase [Micromonosporaceae bacterium]